VAEALTILRDRGAGELGELYRARRNRVPDGAGAVRSDGIRRLRGKVGAGGVDEEPNQIIGVAGNQVDFGDDHVVGTVVQCAAVSERVAGLAIDARTKREVAGPIVFG